MAADDRRLGDLLAGRRPRRARPASRSTLGGPTRPRRLRPTAPLRRRVVLGRRAVLAAPARRALEAHPRLRGPARRAYAGARPGRRAVACGGAATDVRVSASPTRRRPRGPPR